MPTYGFVGLGSIALAPCGYTMATQMDYGACQYCDRIDKCKAFYKEHPHIRTGPKERCKMPISEEYKKIAKIIEFTCYVNEMPLNKIYDLIDWDKFYEEKEKIKQGTTK